MLARLFLQRDLLEQASVCVCLRWTEIELDSIHKKKKKRGSQIDSEKSERKKSKASLLSEAGITPESQPLDDWKSTVEKVIAGVPLLGDAHRQWGGTQTGPRHMRSTQPYRNRWLSSPSQSFLIFLLGASRERRSAVPDKITVHSAAAVE